MIGGSAAAVCPAARHPPRGAPACNRGAARGARACAACAHAHRRVRLPNLGPCFQRRRTPSPLRRRAPRSRLHSPQAHRWTTGKQRERPRGRTPWPRRRASPGPPTRLCASPAPSLHACGPRSHPARGGTLSPQFPFLAARIGPRPRYRTRPRPPRPRGPRGACAAPLSPRGAARRWRGCACSRPGHACPRGQRGRWSVSQHQNGSTNARRSAPRSPS
mmetsp:Transcript_9052/g.26677  ORF Transcript_9052/g.26677 Transcript_9052/m.26677 type:complete len:218 (-) Transcript_9052:178-831(-)